MTSLSTARRGVRDAGPSGWLAAPALFFFLAFAGHFTEQFELDFLDLHEAGGMLVQQVVHFVVQVAYLQLGFQVDLVIVLRLQVVFFGLAVLAHHNDRRGVCGLE